MATIVNLLPIHSLIIRWIAGSQLSSPILEKFYLFCQVLMNKVDSRYFQFREVSISHPQLNGMFDLNSATS